MKLRGDLGHLTYCLNIHATQTWEDVRAALDGPVAAVKAAISPDAPFAVGLRFSGEALEALADPAKRTALAALLHAHDYQAITVNGFPYGRFHGTRVKEDVYQPDWRRAARVRYTNDLADLMAEIAPPGACVSLSTVPGTIKPLAGGALPTMADNYLRSVAHLVALEARSGVTVALAIEPEPYCVLETIAETVSFFRDYLFCAAAVARLADLTGLDRAAAQAALPRHIGLCYDVCHAAVEYEDPAASIAALRAAGIPVHKLQLSAALHVPVMGPDERAALAAFDEPTYLHQVIRRTPEGQKFHVDLPEALALGAATDGEEWRVHFHVPVFLEDLGAFRSTRGFLQEILALHKADPISPHLEIETYTWDVLPDAVRSDSVDKDIAREMRWVLEQLGVRLHTFLALGRVSNLPTVWTNALAGAVLAGAAAPQMPVAAVVITGLALTLFYTGGMWLNDAFDARIDAQERKGRPIPMGEVGVGTVFAGGAAMLGAGVLLAFCLGPAAGLAGLALALAVVLYDWLHKRTVLSPVIMGVTRFLCYCLAALAVARLSGAVILGGLGLLAYVIGLTYAAKQEAYDRLDRVWPLAVLGLPLLYALVQAGSDVVALAIWAGLLVVVLIALRLLLRRNPGDVPRAVVTMIAGISLYDAVLMAGLGHSGLALLAVAGFGLTLLLQRVVSGT